MTELQCAEWLELCSWRITGLEAWGADSDIEAKNGSEMPAAFEVKFIGIEDDAFKMILDSIENGSSARPGPCLYSSGNYLLLRICEAAKQLTGFKGRRIAVVAIERGAWVPFEVSVGWIDWAHPTFFEDANQGWKALLEKEEKHDPNLRAKLPSIVESIDDVWILTRSHEYEYHLEFEFQMRRSGRH